MSYGQNIECPKSLPHICKSNQNNMYTQTTLIGHIGQDCQIRNLEGGRVVTSFSVAYTETWKSQSGEKQERTTWFNCSYFTQSTPGVACRFARLPCVRNTAPFLIAPRRAVNHHSIAKPRCRAWCYANRSISRQWRRRSPVLTTSPGALGI